MIRDRLVPLAATALMAFVAIANLTIVLKRAATDSLTPLHALNIAGAAGATVVGALWLSILWGDR